MPYYLFIYLFLFFLKNPPYLVEVDTNSQVKDCYLITPETLIKAKPGMIVLHPLPRVNEIRLVDSLSFWRGNVTLLYLLLPQCFNLGQFV